MSIFIRILRYLSVIAGFIALPAAPAFSQKLKLNAYLDTTTILIGDQVHFTIELEQPANVKVTFPALKDTLGSKIEILESEPADTNKIDNNIRIRKKYLITSFDSGYHEIPALKFAFNLGGNIDTISSQQLFLTVNTLPVDSAKEIMDIKPVMNTPFTLREIKNELIIGALLLAILALVIWIIIRRRKNKPIFIPWKPQEPAHVIALRELDSLREEKLWQKGQVKLYYTRITDILRKYITVLFSINAMEMTSEEIFDSMQDELNRDMDLKSSFTKLLKQADMVKFAKEEPLPQENEISLLSAYTFVNRTKIEVINKEPDKNGSKLISGKE